MKTGATRQQKGAVAIEFALVFVIFFAVFYGLLGYGLPMVMLQSFHQASAEAVRRCVALDPTSNSYATDVPALAKQVVGQQLAWMPASLGFNANTDVVATLTPGRLLTVQVSYSKARLANVLPLLNLPLIGEVPRLPAQLQAQASLQL